MLSPEYLARIAEGSEEIASQLHTYIIRQIIDRMMMRIGRGSDYLLTSSDRWRIHILQDAGYLLEDITAELSKVTKRQEKEIKAAMEEAGIKALEYDHKIYEAAGLSTVPLTQSPQLIRLMERNLTATMGEWENYTRTTAESAQRLFINECDNAYHLVSSGAVAYTQAVKEAVNNVVSGGVIVQYPSGHKDTIETATARAVRTGVAQATGDISIKRMGKWSGILYWYRRTSGPELEMVDKIRAIIYGGKGSFIAALEKISAFLHFLRLVMGQVKDYVDGTAAIVSAVGMV